MDSGLGLFIWPSVCMQNMPRKIYVFNCLFALNNMSGLNHWTENLCIEDMASGFPRSMNITQHLWYFLFHSYIQAILLSYISWLQAVVVVSIIYPSGSPALRGQKWLCRTMQVTASIGSNTDKSIHVLALFCDATCGFTQAAKTERQYMETETIAWTLHIRNVSSSCLDINY